MTLHTLPLIAKVEVAVALIPEPGESIEQLHARAVAAGLPIVSIHEDRVVVLHVEET